MGFNDKKCRSCKKENIASYRTFCPYCSSSDLVDENDSSYDSDFGSSAWDIATGFAAGSLLGGFGGGGDSGGGGIDFGGGDFGGGGASGDW